MWALNAVKKVIARAEVEDLEHMRKTLPAAFTSYRTIHSIQKTRGGHENLEFSGTQYCNIMSQ